MPPRCGHRDHLGRECGLLQGHATWDSNTGHFIVEHDFVDTPKSLRQRGGAAASDRIVRERAENDALLDEQRRVALIDQVQSSANCKTCFGARHQDHCPRYREQLEARLIRTDQARRWMVNEINSLVQAVTDLEASQDHGSQELRTFRSQLTQLEHDNDSLRGLVKDQRERLTAAGLELNLAREESATAWANQLEHVEDVVLVEELLRRVKEDQR